MLLGMFAAAAIAAQQPQPSDEVAADLRCMLAMSYALATIDEGGAKADDEERSGIVSLVMYFVGKIDGRMPAFDYTGEVTKLVQTPGYAESGLAQDLDRCGEEAIKRGQTLTDVGKQLENIIPLIERPVG